MTRLKAEKLGFLFFDHELRSVVKTKSPSKIRGFAMCSVGFRLLDEFKSTAHRVDSRGCRIYLYTYSSNKKETMTRGPAPLP